MRKYTLTFLFFSAFLYSASAVAFMLPPFKFDIGTTLQETLTYCKTTANNVAKTIQDSSIVQTTISYGEGAKEALEYGKKARDLYQGFDLNNLGGVIDDLQKAETAKSKTAEQAALEIETMTTETNAKIVAIDKNQTELRNKIMEDPKNAKKYQKKIDKNEATKNKLAKALSKDIGKKNKKRESEIFKLDKKIGDLKDKAKGLVSSIKFVPSDYDSTKDLQETAAGVLPENEKDVSFQVMQAFQQRYKMMHYADLQMAIYRSSNIRATLEKDNKSMQEDFKAVDTMEGSTPSVTALIKMRTENVKALITYTELLLQRLQLLMAYDLAYGKFGAANIKQATAEFNFDNYKFVMPTPEAYNASKDGMDVVEGEEIEESLEAPSDQAFLDGLANANSEAEENPVEEEPAEEKPVEEKTDEKK